MLIKFLKFYLNIRFINNILIFKVCYNKCRIQILYRNKIEQFIYNINKIFYDRCIIALQFIYSYIKFNNIPISYKS